MRISSLVRWPKLLYHYNINENTLNYTCRELDSYLWPSEKQYEKVFSRPWFVAYISGFIRTQLHSLSTSGFSGEMSIARVNNIDLVTRKVEPAYFARSLKEGNKVISAAINALVEELLSMGGVRDTKKQNVTFSFGNGEMY